MLTGNALWNQIIARQVPRGRAVSWFMGQHGFVIKTGSPDSKIICIDVFFTRNPDRLVPPPLDPSDVVGADLIIGTHDHSDHIDHPSWPALTKASPAAPIVVPEILRERLAADMKLDLSRLVGIDDGRVLQFGPIELKGVVASHEFLDRDPVTGLHPWMGVIIRAGGVAIYHSGDTCLYEGIHERLRAAGKLDAMLIPINGRSAKQLKANIIGNMTYQEAADLAGTFKPGIVVPTHFDMFAANLGDPAAFEAYVNVKYPGQRVWVPVVGEGIEIGGA